jgi:hypothetical protein
MLRPAGVREAGFLRAWSMVLALVVGLGPALPAAGDAGRQVKITGATANVRSQPSVHGQLLFQVRTGELLVLLDVAGDWYHVEASGGRQGYLYRNLAEILEPPPPQAPPAPPAPEAAPAPSQAPVSIEHKEVGCIVAEQHPRLEACFNPGSNLGRAEIHFRALESDPWYAVRMDPDGPCHSALLPKPLKTTKQIQYYVDAVDRAFSESEQPDGAPAGAYRVRVVEKQQDCEKTKLMARSMMKTTNPITVSVARSAQGVSLDPSAVTQLESQLLLSGFSTQGVLVSSTGAAPAGAAAAKGSGGGGSHVLLIAAVAGGVAAGAVGIAVAAGGGSSSSNTTSGGSGGSGTSGGSSSSPGGSTCSAESIAAGSNGSLVAVTPDEVCTNFMSCGRHNFRTCKTGVCSTTNCRYFYELDTGGTTISCTSPAACTDPNGIVNCIVGAAEQLVNACQ